MIDVKLSEARPRLLFSVELLRCSEGAADVEGGRLHRLTGIAENQPDEIVDDKDEAERETNIEQCGDDEERHLHPSHGRGRRAAAGCGERGEENIGMAVVHGNFPGFATNSQ
ncbi:hypothetical protein [Rhizobium chutanense]|uniref:hypothetical protein n=1 Tax=Rhizobium chutanense TaxID=2035448 RepID=UPI0015CEFF94